MNKKMEIYKIQVPIRELIDGYENTDEKGLVAYKGLLQIRPPYQREFIYNSKEQKAVIDTILKNRPLNIMYWGKNKDGTFEVIDGQQRTLSIINFAQGDFSVSDSDGNLRSYNGVTSEKIREVFENYEITVYVCEGDVTEKLAWFETINIPTKTLTNQELRNAVYTGRFITEARKYFSKNGEAYRKFNLLISGQLDRQDWLEKFLMWISKGKYNVTIDNFLAKNIDTTAEEFINEIRKIHTWIMETFLQEDESYINDMKKVPWGELYYYNKKNENYGQDQYEHFKEEISKLMEDSDVQNKKGIFEYIIKNDEKYLNIRSFPNNDAKSIYTKQKGKCANPECPSKDKEFKFNEMEADHITPWSAGGKTTIENLQMLCVSCNRRKSNK